MNRQQKSRLKEQKHQALVNSALQMAEYTKRDDPKVKAARAEIEKVNVVLGENMKQRRELAQEKSAKVAILKNILEPHIPKELRDAKEE